MLSVGPVSCGNGLLQLLDGLRHVLRKRLLHAGNAFVNHVFARVVLREVFNVRAKCADVGLVALDVVGVPMGVHDVPHGLIGYLLDFRDQVARPTRTQVRIHDNDVVLIDDEGAVGIDAVLPDGRVRAVGYLDDVKRLRPGHCAKAAERQAQHEDHHNCAPHQVPPCSFRIPHGSRGNLLRCRRMPCNLTQPSRTTPYERLTTLEWPLLGCRVCLAALCWQSLEPLAASNLCEESVESYASNVQEPRLPYTSTNGCLRRAPPGVTPPYCSPGVSARAKPEPCSEQFAERTHSPAKLRRCLASRQKALLEGWHVPTRAQLRAQGRSRALLQRRTR